MRAEKGSKTIKPTFQSECHFWSHGKITAGVDEVGRGALAGPVVAGCVILPPFIDSSWIKQVRDSKLLTARQRNHLSPNIMEEALDWSIGIVTSPIIDELNILRATWRAMEQAVLKLKYPPQCLLVDGTRIPGIEIPQQSIIAGDKKCISIACASIIAKVTRDNIMKELDKMFPDYGFSKHKGYGTKQHLECIERLGAISAHRHSFSPISKYLKEQTFSTQKHVYKLSLGKIP